VDVHWVRYGAPRALQRTFYGAGVFDNLRRDPAAWPGLLAFPLALAASARARLQDCDALVSHWALPCALAAAGARADRPHLAVLHSADVHLLAQLPGRGRLAAAIARGASQLLFVSGAQRQRFLDLLPTTLRASVAARAHVQPMGIDLPARVPTDRDALRRELGLDRFSLLTIARLVPVKGLLEAAQALAHRADLTWLIAGDGPEAAQLSALAARARLRMRLLGTVTGARKRALLQAADAFVLPSRVLRSGRSEGTPTALLEAMAHGLPALAGAVGGIPELVRPLETGLLFEPSQAGALELAVDRLIGDASLRAALAARARSEAERHGWRTIAPRIEALLAV
jgi:glycosyltransferase involved in cell wall biosynthesis